mgnify:CR=1 FL=1
MKKTFYGFCCFVLGASYSFAQCTPAVPSNANVATGYSLSGLSNATYWVCSGGTVKSASAFSAPTNKTVFLETNATFSTDNSSSYPDAGNNTIYAKNGSTVNINSVSSNNTIYHEPSANLNSTGTNPTLVPCNSLVYDYTNAPSNGCVSGIEEYAYTNATKIFPIPAQSEISVIIDGQIANKFKNFNLIIYNLLGKEIYKSSFSNSKIILKKEELTSGVFFYKVLTQENGQKVIGYGTILFE